MADATPHGVPVTNFKRYLVRALRPCEQIIDATGLQQAEAIARLDAAKEGVKLLSVELLVDTKHVVVDNVPLIDEGELYELPPGGP